MPKDVGGTIGVGSWSAGGRDVQRVFFGGVHRRGWCYLAWPGDGVGGGRGGRGMRGGRVCAVEWIYFFVPTYLGGTFATGCWVGGGLPGLLGVVGVLGLLGLLGPVLRLLVLGVLVLGVVALGLRLRLTS